MTNIPLCGFGGVASSAWVPPSSPAGSAVLWSWGIVDLGQPSDFIAWCTVNYLNGLQGNWDGDNGYAVELRFVDWQSTPVTATGGKLAPWGSSLHKMAWQGRGRELAFLLTVFNPQEMEVAAEAIVLHDF